VPLLELIVRNIVHYPQSATSTSIRYRPAIRYLLAWSHVISSFLDLSSSSSPPVNHGWRTWANWAIELLVSLGRLFPFEHRLAVAIDDGGLLGAHACQCLCSWTGPDQTSRLAVSTWWAHARPTRKFAHGTYAAYKSLCVVDTHKAHKKSLVRCGPPHLHTPFLGRSPPIHLQSTS
jgi:hypothetical protein